jgi:hypothetical protein
MNLSLRLKIFFEYEMLKIKKRKLINVQFKLFILC